MPHIRFFRAVVHSALVLISSVLTKGYSQNLAATPPMGWNSWDSYGLTINEADFKANAEVLASIAKYG